MAVEIPADMVERAARALASEHDDATLFDGKQFSGAHWDGQRDLYRADARAALAAALDGCDVRQEYHGDRDQAGRRLFRTVLTLPPVTPAEED